MKHHVILDFSKIVKILINLIPSILIFILILESLDSKEDNILSKLSNKIRNIASIKTLKK